MIKVKQKNLKTDVRKNSCDVYKLFNKSPPRRLDSGKKGPKKFSLRKPQTAIILPGAEEKNDESDRITIVDLESCTNKMRKVFNQTIKIY